MFSEFFNGQLNPLENLYIQLYLFRTSAVERVVQETSELENVLLRKLKAVRTFTFTKYAFELILPRVKEVNEARDKTLADIFSQQNILNSLDKAR